MEVQGKIYDQGSYCKGMHEVFDKGKDMESMEEEEEEKRRSKVV